MALSKEQFQQIHDALLDGYNEFPLRQMVRLRLGEDLDRIAGGSNLDERVFHLVEWADRTGRVRELVQEAYEYNPTNPTLKKLFDVWFSPESPVVEVVEAPSSPDTSSPQIFLSYSRKDSAYMRRVLRLLEAAGLSAWTDEGLEPGTAHWQRAIENAIRSTQCVVVLLSPDANLSEWVSREVNYAQALGRRIFPVLLRGTQVESVPLSLFNVQYLDARQNLADAVSRLLMPALTRYLSVVGMAPSKSGVGGAHRSEGKKQSNIWKYPVVVGLIVTAIIGAITFTLLTVEFIPLQTTPSPLQAENHIGVVPGADDTPIPTPTLPTITYTPTRIPPTDIPTAIPVPEAGATWVNPIDKAVYVWIEEGEFLMGSAPTVDTWAQEDEKPQHTVHLNGFWIMRTEVTNEQYERCVKAEVCEKSGNERWNSEEFTREPVTHVTWHQARTYAAWVGGRLPTEAEWEKACRGQDGRIYPWGNEAPDPTRLNYGGSGLKGVVQVGSYPPSAHGLFDMAGNVFEWTSSKWGPEFEESKFGYRYDPNDGREDLEGDEYRTLRGGSWYYAEDRVRCAARFGFGPYVRVDDLGFRVVWSPGS